MAMGEQHSESVGTGHHLWTCLETKGPGRFVTRRVFQRSDELVHIWTARAHRKGLVGEVELAERWMLREGLWSPRELNWWIGTLFAMGSLLFALGCVLSLAPALAHALKDNSVRPSLAQSP